MQLKQAEKKDPLDKQFYSTHTNSKKRIPLHPGFYPNLQTIVL